MFACLRELSASGVIDACVEARFTRSDRPQLVVGRGRELQVFDILDDASEDGLNNANNNNNNNSSNANSTNASASSMEPCLQMCGNFELFGRLESLNAVSSGKPGDLDLLLLTFGSGRASLVGWSADLGPHKLRTVALYNFEGEALGSNLRADSPGNFRIHGYGGKAYAEVDPFKRCAVMYLNGFQIAVMPFQTLKLWMSAEKSDLQEDMLAEEEATTVRLARAVRHVAIDADDVWEMPPGCFLIDLVRLGIPCGSVLHMTFLQDQRGLPVLAILHAGPVRSGTGRLVVSRWTTQLTAITISKEDVSVVWNVKRLPHDALAVVPTSTGDALVLSQNAIHHIVGGSVKRALELNGFARTTADTELVASDRAPSEISLDGVRYTWLDNHRLLMSLRYGQLVVLDVGPDSLTMPYRALANQCSCMCLLGQKYIFLGSRVSDSVLLSFRLFLKTRAEGAMLGSLFDDPEERELYEAVGNSQQAENGEPGPLAPLSSSTENPALADPQHYLGTGIDESQAVPYQGFTALRLRVVDALPVAGPVGGLTVSEIRADDVEVRRAKEVAEKLQLESKHSKAAWMLKEANEAEKERRKPKEILITAGRGRDGGVRVLCPGLRLDAHEDLLKEIQLEEPSQNMFTFELRDDRAETVVLTSTATHNLKGFRCLGDNRTFTTEPLTDSDTEPFESSKQATVLVAVHNDWVVRATSDGLYVHERKLPLTQLASQLVSLRAAYSCEDHVLAVTRDRQPLIFHIERRGDSTTITNVDIDFTEGDSDEAPVVSGFVYRDADTQHLMCALVRGGVSEKGAGAFELFDITNKSLKFRSSHALAVGESTVENVSPSTPLEPHQGVLARLKVSSVCVARVGRVDADQHSASHKVPPVLCLALALLNGDLLLYRIYGDWERLHRVQHDVVTRLDRNISQRSRQQQQQQKQQQQQQQQQKDDEDEEMETEQPADNAANEHGVEVGEKRERVDAMETAGLKARRTLRRSNLRLIPFDYLNGFCGMIMFSSLGTSACVIGARGSISAVRIDTDAYLVHSMAVNRGRLLMLASTKGSVRGAGADSLPRFMAYAGFKLLRHMRLDHGGSVPMVEVPLQASVSKVEYDRRSRAHFLLCHEDDPSEETHLAVRSRSSIRLLCADTLRVLDQYTLQRFEKGINATNVTIDISAQNATFRKNVEFCAVGTGFVGPDGEDAGCKGRVLVFEVEKKRIKLWNKIESRHIRGPVTSVCSVDGHLVCSFGSSPCSLRIFYYDPNQSAFVARSFIDTPFSAIALKNIKNYLVVGDLIKSVQFIHWHTQEREFRPLAKDTQLMQTYAADFVQLERQLGILATDNNGNIHIKQFNNKRFLTQRGEINVGAPVNHIVRLQVTPDHSVGLYGTLDGTMGAVIPCQEPKFRRLLALQAAMSTSALVPRNAGLNPRAFRLAVYDEPLRRQRSRNICDGALLYKFPMLDALAQRQLARLIGTTPETILQDLFEIDRDLFSCAL